MMRALAVLIMSVWVSLAPLQDMEVIVTSAVMNDNLTLTTEYGWDIELMGEAAGDWLVNLDNCPDTMVIGETYDIILVNGNTLAIMEVE